MKVLHFDHMGRLPVRWAPSLFGWRPPGRNQLRVKSGLPRFCDLGPDVEVPEAFFKDFQTPLRFLP